MRRACLLVLLPWLLRAPAAARADAPAAAYTPPEYILRPPALPPHLGGRRPRQMALSEAIAGVLRRNLTLSAERERVREADTARPLALALFEPTLLAAGGRFTAQSPPLTAQEGQAGQVLSSTTDSWGLRLQGRLPTGALLSLDFTNTRIESALGTAVSPLFYRSTLLLSLTQPLLRDFSFTGRVQWAPVLRARFDSEAAREGARLRALVTVKATEDAYWTLVESWRRYGVAQEARALAEQQVELSRRQIASGTLAESEIIGVEGTLAQRQVAVVGAEAQIEEAADVLRRLMNLPPEEWDQPLVPLDPPGFKQVAVPFEAAWERAVAGRPELRQADLDLRRVALDLDLARNARLPRLNAQAAAGLVGQDEGYGAALQQVRERSGWQGNAGLDLSWAPLGIGARAEVRRLQAVLQRTGLGRDQLLVDIRGQLRTALRAIDTAERQLYASARFRDLAERSLDIEQRRFLNGMSNNIFVSQRQAELLQARLGEIQALIQHQKASSDLLLATGELLEARRLRFDVGGGG